MPKKIHIQGDHHAREEGPQKLKQYLAENPSSQPKALFYEEPSTADFDLQIANKPSSYSGDVGERSFQQLYQPHSSTLKQVIHSVLADYSDLALSETKSPKFTPEKFILSMQAGKTTNILNAVKKRFPKAQKENKVPMPEIGSPLERFVNGMLDDRALNNTLANSVNMAVRANGVYGISDANLMVSTIGEHFKEKAKHGKAMAELLVSCIEQGVDLYCIDTDSGSDSDREKIMAQRTTQAFRENNYQEGIMLIGGAHVVPVNRQLQHNGIDVSVSQSSYYQEPHLNNASDTGLYASKMNKPSLNGTLGRNI